MISLFTSIPVFKSNNTPAINRKSNIKYSNLAPLAKDTLSFKQTTKELTDEQNRKFGISRDDAVKLSNDTLASKNYLKNQLEDV